MWSKTINKFNLSYDELFKAEKSEGRLTKFGAMAVDTGKFTGRSPEDKYFVAGGPAGNNIWWRDEKSPTSPNKPIAIETWDYLFSLAKKQLGGKELFVMDGYLGARETVQMKVRLHTEIAWQAHFFKNMFLRKTVGSVPTVPDWTIYSASKAIVPEWEKYGLNSEVAVAINLEKRQVVILGTWYGGEIKKGMFTVANYVLPLKGVGSFHCSANIGKDGSSALFFGLSGTGKTTLSHDPDRLLIGDDETGWDDEGIFNLEGGCYAKVINLSKTGEQQIYQAIKRNALLENVAAKPDGSVDFSDASKTENTRMSYPIEHIGIRVKGPLVGPHPKTIIFLTCDSFGILPPVARLTEMQARFWFLSGYTAKIAGTERGINEPKAAFSACFGQPFLPLHPTVYAKILTDKIKKHRCQVYLVNTGWSGGGYGVGKRVDLAVTRQIVSDILTGKMARAAYFKLTPFNLLVPKEFNPRDTWFDKITYDREAKKLAGLFDQNFKRFS